MNTFFNPRFLPNGFPLARRRNTHPLPEGWPGVSLQQWEQLQRLANLPLPETSICQAAVLARSTPRQARYFSPAAYRKLSFLHTPPEPVPPTGKLITLRGEEFTAVRDLGELPLAQYIRLERDLLRQPQLRKGLQQAQAGSIAWALALVWVPVSQPFNERLLQPRRQALLHTPVPLALGAVRQLLQEVNRLQALYPELFAREDAPPENTPADDSAAATYTRRWGWNALLAELQGGPLSPAQRKEWLQSPAHLVLQELARLRHLQQVQAAAHQTATAAAHPAQ